MKPTVSSEDGLPDKFVLDEKFKSDVDLQYDFAEEARKILQEKFHEENPWL